MSDGRYTLVTGGCGFVGTNLVHRLLDEGEPVCIFDDLSRAGVRQNLEWLRSTHGDRFQLIIGDVRDSRAVREAVMPARRVFHLAAQVAVTTSLADPLADFDINARGTLNILESVRLAAHRPPVVFTSTNKVYGGLPWLRLLESDRRHEPRSARIAAHGLDERCPLDFQSPYGCSKGAADQYVRDYARSYGLQCVVFRMSCIYGPHQFGNEDQGWVAHFLIRALHRQPITIFGDGKQVRDILFVDDLVEALLAAAANARRLAGWVFNVGGGPANAISLRDLIEMIREADGFAPALAWEGWRTGDQKYYVSNTRSLERMTGWQPRVAAREGVARLRKWLMDSMPAQLGRVTGVAPGDAGNSSEATNERPSSQSNGEISEQLGIDRRH